MKSIDLEREGEEIYITAEDYSMNRIPVSGDELAYRLCAWICDLNEQVRQQNQQLQTQADQMQDLRVEVEQANKKLKQFKQTFVEARALHDLRAKVENVLSVFIDKTRRDIVDGEMRRFIKQYQDRVESWPVNTSKPLMSEDDIPAHIRRSLGIEPRMPRANAEPILEAGEKVLSKKEKHRIRLATKFPTNSIKEFGYLYKHVRAPEFHERVGSWQRLADFCELDLVMYVEPQWYSFYGVPRRE